MYKNLKNLRTSQGMTQEEFGKTVGVTKTTYSNYETGERAPKSDFWIKVAQVYGVSIDYLMGYTDDPTPIKKKASSLSDKAVNISYKYDKLDAHGKRMVEMVLEEETSRMLAEAMEEPEETKVIPLIGNSFAAGSPEPDFGNMWEDYSVPASSRAEFAIRINGDSMEPYLPDGSIALGIKTTPRDGDVAALLLDGEFLCKQFSKTPAGDIRLYSLNRARSDADVNIPRDSGRQLLSFGVILMDKKVALP